MRSLSTMFRPSFVFVALFALLSLSASTFAQDKPTAKSKAEPEQIPGYKIRKMHGFQMIISNEVLAEDAKSKLERKPLEVLDLELKTLESIMPPRALNVLRNVLIWVEWDEQLDMRNGRSGGALAVYFGGDQLQLLREGMHPLKAKNVTILSMKSLAQEHQPSRDSGRCIILHEIAHAVHNQLVGYSNPAVKAAYAQAMQKKLYDPKMYISTNEREFFAELTCAYYDQLTYYPRTRADLKKHDPVSYQVMESVWGKQRLTKDAGPKGSLGDLVDVRLDKINFGRPVLGPKVTPADLQGRAALIVLWNGSSSSSLSCLPKVATWDAELSDFGLATVAVHQTGTAKHDVKSIALSRGVHFAVTEAPWVKGGLVEDNKDFPLCLVFDHESQCIYRGSPFDAEKIVRAAVGKALVAGAWLGEYPKQLETLVDLLSKGNRPSSLLPRLMQLTRAKDEETADAAKLLVAKMTEPGQKALDEADTLTLADPVAAYLLVERLPSVYKETEVASRANKAIAELKKNKAVTKELQARKYLTVVKNLDTELTGRPGSFDPTQPRFRRDNAALLNQLQAAVQQMRASFPTTKATEQAVRIGERYGFGGS